MHDEHKAEVFRPEDNPPSPTPAQGTKPGGDPVPPDPPTNSLQAPATPKRKAPAKRNKPRPTTRSARGQSKGA